MPNNYPAVVGEDTKETPQAKRLRLASELRFLTQQFNSKLAELLDSNLDVVIQTPEGALENRNALIGNVEVSFQTSRKYY